MSLNRPMDGSFDDPIEARVNEMLDEGEMGSDQLWLDDWVYRLFLPPTPDYWDFVHPGGHMGSYDTTQEEAMLYADATTPSGEMVFDRLCVMSEYSQRIAQGADAYWWPYA